jgi:hypothetical protein
MSSLPRKARSFPGGLWWFVGQPASLVLTSPTFMGQPRAVGHLGLAARLVQGSSGDCPAQESQWSRLLRVAEWPGLGCPGLCWFLHTRCSVRLPTSAAARSNRLRTAFTDERNAPGKYSGRKDAGGLRASNSPRSPLISPGFPGAPCSKRSSPVKQTACAGRGAKNHLVGSRRPQRIRYG